MTTELFKILYYRRKRWYDKFQQLAKDVAHEPKSTVEPIPGGGIYIKTNYRRNRILRMWKSIYEDFVRVQLSKDENGDYFNPCETLNPAHQY